MRARAKTLDGDTVEGYHREDTTKRHELVINQNNGCIQRYIDPTTLEYQIGDEWYSMKNLELMAKLVHTGMDAHMEGKIAGFKEKHYIALEPRSSMRAKGLICDGAIVIKVEGKDYTVEKTGIIDLDYPNELKLIVHNPTKPYTIKEDFASRTYIKVTDKFIIKKGDKISQVMLCEHKSYLFGIESEVERSGGIGSTS